MKEVYVIQEKDLQDGEIDIIGVADSMDNVEEMLKKYYGDDYIEYIPFDEDILGYDEPSIRRVKVEAYKFDVIIRWFAINEI